MPLTHDMGLIGFYLMQFANRVHINLMPTELFVRRPLLWLQTASKKRATITCSPNFGYRHFLKVLGDRKLEGVDLSSIAADLQRRGADFGRAVQRIHDPRSPTRG
jgi:iturin family lipopeptide synthetase A